jgi:segregation and condensation protein B
MTEPEEGAPVPAWAVDAVEEAPAAQPAAPADAVPPPPERIIEAFLFVGGAPLTAERAVEAIRGLTAAQFQEAIAALNQAYRTQGRPYLIQAKEHGHQLALRPEFRAVIEKLYHTTREARLSQAAIDVLSLVAYRQPVTRQEVESIRGAESATVLRQLVRRGLIAIVGHGQASQREVLYGTTPRFLELFGLRGLDDLPQTQDLQRL